jgi:hypothetical protein
LPFEKLERAGAGRELRRIAKPFFQRSFGNH